MRVKRAVEPSLGATLPQCMAPHTEDAVSVRLGGAERRRLRVLQQGRDPERCARGARWWLDGKPYCNIHAGELALKELLRQEKSPA